MCLEQLSAILVQSGTGGALSMLRIHSPDYVCIHSPGKYIHKQNPSQHLLSAINTYDIE